MVSLHPCTSRRHARSCAQPARPRASTALALCLAALAASGCAKQTVREADPFPIQSHLTVYDGTRSHVDGLPGWNGGCFWPSVDLYSGNFFLTYELSRVSAPGLDWDFALCYNSTLGSELTAMGRGWRHSYDIHLEVGVPGPGDITVRWGDGRRDVFTFDGGGWASHPSLEGRRITSVVGGYVLRNKHSLEHEFDSSGRLTTIRDRNGNTILLTYDFFGRLIQIQDPVGRTLDFTYDGLDRIIAASGLPAAPIQFVYAGDYLSQVVDPGGFPCQIDYDVANLVKSVTDADGDPLLVEYHPGFPVVQRVRAPGGRRDFYYDAPSRTTTVMDSTGPGPWSMTRYEFDPVGLAIRVEDGPLGVTQNVYDPVHYKLTDHTDADGHLTQMTYDALGNLLTTTDPIGGQIQVTYDPVHNLPLSLTDKKGATWTFQRDANGNLLSEVDPLAYTRNWTYFPNGLVSTAQDQNGHVTSYTYDALGNLASKTDPAGHTWSATWNARGAPMSVTDPAGKTWSCTRNLRDEAIAITLPDGNAYNLSWTGSGYVGSVQDPTGAIRMYSYDAMNRLVREVRPLGELTRWIRDGAGDVTEIVSPGGTSVRYEYDAAGRRVKRVDPVGGTWTYTYGFVDLLSATDALGITTTYQHSPRHELIQIVAPGVTTGYTYDTAGRLLTAVLNAPPDPPLSYTYGYDAADRRISVTANHLVRSAQFTLDAAGQPLSVQDNLRPGPVNFTWDVRGLPIGVDPLGFGMTASLLHNPRRELLTILYSNGVRSDYAYDAMSRLITVQNQAPGFNAVYNMTYDARGDRVHVGATTPAAGPIDRNVTFDPSGRPVFEEYIPGGVTTYAYDPIGNRTQKNGPGGLDLYTYDAADRLITAGPVTQTWNANGKVVNATLPGALYTYVYRSDGALKSVTVNGQTWEFLVGPHGEVARVVLPGGQEVWYAYDTADVGLLRKAALPAPLALPTDEYIYAPGGLGSKSGAYAPLRPAYTPVIWLKAPFLPASVRLPLSGENGVAQVADPAGNLESDQYYDLFGTVLAKICPQPVPAPGYQAMDHADGMETLFLPTEPIPWVTDPDPNQPLPSVTTDFHPGIAEPGQTIDTEPVPYLPRTGSFLEDLGFGPDGLITFQDQEGPVKPPPPSIDKEPVIIEIEIVALDLTGCPSRPVRIPVGPAPPPKRPSPQWISSIHAAGLDGSVTLEKIRQEMELKGILEIINGGGCVLPRKNPPKERWWK